MERQRKRRAGEECVCEIESSRSESRFGAAVRWFVRLAHHSSFDIAFAQLPIEEI